jgi:hypothetical protein
VDHMKMAEVERSGGPAADVLRPEFRSEQYHAMTTVSLASSKVPRRPLTSTTSSKTQSGSRLQATRTSDRWDATPSSSPSASSRQPSGTRPTHHWRS